MNFKRYMTIALIFCFCLFFSGCIDQTPYFGDLDIPTEISGRYTLPSETNKKSISWDSDVSNYIGRDNLVKSSLVEDKTITFTGTVKSGNKKYSESYIIFFSKQKSSTSDHIGFQSYFDSLFVEFMKGSPFNINFTLLYPERYGLENETIESESSTLSYENIIAGLEEFSYEELSLNQQIQYDILEYSIKESSLLEGYEELTTSLGSYLGYNTSIISSLSEYHFYREYDIKNYFAYLKATKDDFKEIIQFEKEKIANGMGLPNYIIEGAMEQVENFIKKKPCYLLEVFNDKVAVCDYLTDDKKISYQTQHEKIINNDFLGAYEYLLEELKTLKDHSKNNLGLSHYERGSSYYERLFQQNCATTMSCDILIEYLNSYIKKYKNKLMFASNSTMEAYASLDLLGDMSVEECMTFFKESIQSDFPCAGKFDYTINDVAEALQENTSPAYYFPSVFDADVVESIYINPLQATPSSNMDFETKNYLYTLLAHEGIPGHMYQTVYTKKLETFSPTLSSQSFGSYVEGWATYAEKYVLKYKIKNDAVRDYYIANDDYTYLIYCRADVGINYEGWDVNRVLKFFKDNFFNINILQAEGILQTLREIPTNYLKYYFGYMQILDLQKMAKEELGDKYTDYGFHEAFLSYGPAPWYVVRELIDLYVVKNK